MHFRRRCNTQAILEKAREIVSPSNGASTFAKPSTDPSAVQADVLQNLGKHCSPDPAHFATLICVSRICAIKYHVSI